MNFDPTANRIVALCVSGMEKENQLDTAGAKEIFLQAWDEATNDFEKFTAAHYVARHQDSVSAKLQWDFTALHHAEQCESEALSMVLPSLHLNIGKGHEDLNQYRDAWKSYEQARICSDYLPDDGYGRMIKMGIAKGFERLLRMQ